MKVGLPILLFAAVALAACGDNEGGSSADSPDPGFWFAAAIPADVDDPDPRVPVCDIRVFNGDLSEDFTVGERTTWVDLAWSPDAEWLFAVELEVDADTIDAKAHFFAPFEGDHREFRLESDQLGGYPRWSPDGERVALVGGLDPLRVIDRDGNVYGPADFGFDEGGSGPARPVWSPDSEHVAFVVNSGLAIADRDGNAVVWAGPDDWRPDDFEPAINFGTINYVRWVDATTVAIDVLTAPSDQDATDDDQDRPGHTITGVLEEGALEWVDVSAGWDEVHAAMDVWLQLRDAIPHDDVVEGVMPIRQYGIYPGEPLMVLVGRGEVDRTANEPLLAGAEIGIATFHDGDYLEIPLGFDGALLGARRLSQLPVHAVILE